MYATVWLALIGLRVFENSAFAEAIDGLSGELT